MGGDSGALLDELERRAQRTTQATPLPCSCADCGKIVDWMLDGVLQPVCYECGKKRRGEACPTKPVVEHRDIKPPNFVQVAEDWLDDNGADANDALVASLAEELNNAFNEGTRRCSDYPSNPGSVR